MPSHSSNLALVLVTSSKHTFCSFFVGGSSISSTGGGQLGKGGEGVRDKLKICSSVQVVFNAVLLSSTTWLRHSSPNQNTHFVVVNFTLPGGRQLGEG